MKPSLLIIDDNEELLTALRLFLKPFYQNITVVKTPDRIPALLLKEGFDVILLDMNFNAGIANGNEGLYWLRRILETDPLAVVVMITAYGDIELAVKAMKEGAADFIHKSWDEDKILSSLLAANKLRQSKKEVEKLKIKQDHLLESAFQNPDYCPCHSDSMLRVLEIVNKVAASDANILLLGENGTGKEVLARMIHQQSSRSREIFVSVDLGSLSGSLFESEVFGHVKGAFTDAFQDKPGRLEIANGGTLFLDEIGNLPFEFQSRLLSVLQNREVVRLGDVKKIQVDFRLISATNMPLTEMIREKRFREDLLYRINTVQIDLPPLRARVEDIPDLAAFFAEKYAKKYHRSLPGISKSVIRKMQEYAWPGNVRELQHVIEKAVILGESDVIENKDIHFNTGSVNPRSYTHFNLIDHEKEIIGAALQSFGGNMSLTAQKLGINRSTLYEKIKRYGL